MLSITGDTKTPALLPRRARAPYGSTGMPGGTCMTGVAITFIQGALDVRPHQRSFGRRDQRPG